MKVIMYCFIGCTDKASTWYLGLGFPDGSNLGSTVLCGLCCFSHSAYWLPTRKKLLYTVVNPARGLLNREKIKIKAWQRTPPQGCSSGENKIKITGRIYMPRRYAGLGPPCVRTRIPSTRRLGQWVSFRKILRFRVR